MGSLSILCKGSFGDSNPVTPTSYRRLMRIAEAEAFHSLVPEAPWIMRGENALVSLFVLLGLLIAAIIARLQWGM